MTDHQLFDNDLTAAARHQMARLIGRVLMHVSEQVKVNNRWSLYAHRDRWMYAQDFKFRAERIPSVSMQY